MKYLSARFTLPASSGTSQETWDLATLTETRFIKKYDITPKIYERLLNGEGSVEEVIKKNYIRIY